MKFRICMGFAALTFLLILPIKATIGLSTVYGHVKDGVTGRPLQAAIIVDIKIDKVKVRCFADGWFQFSGPPGSWDIEITADGYYGKKIVGVESRDGDFIFLGEFKLNPRTYSVKRSVSVHSAPGSFKQTGKVPGTASRTAHHGIGSQSIHYQGGEKGWIRFNRTGEGILRFHCGQVARVQWRTGNLKRGILRHIPVHLALYERNGGREIGRIASRLNPGVGFFTWTCGRLQSGRAVSPGIYTLKLVTLSGQVADKIALSLR